MTRSVPAIVADIDTANQPAEAATGELAARQSTMAWLAIELADAVRPVPFGSIDVADGILAAIDSGMSILVRSITVPEVGPAVIELDNGDRYQIDIRKLDAT